MDMKHPLIVMLSLTLVVLGVIAAMDPSRPGPVPVPAYPQRSGNPDSGYHFLVYGDYVNSGVPLSFYRLGFGKDRRNALQRTGVNASIQHDFTAVKAANGATIVVPNCLQCHAQRWGDSLVIGLGNSLGDYTLSRAISSPFATHLVDSWMRQHPEAEAAAQAFLRVSRTVGRQMATQVRGVNPADRLTALLVTHRDPNTLAWSDTPARQLSQTVIPSDVPAWWLLKKKNAMFYSGLGRGDFGRFLMGAILLTVNDTVQANRVDARMGDVLAYIKSLQPPAYPGPIDSALAGKGQSLFHQHCAGCHGTYGPEGRYPNLLIPQAVIGTDSLLNHSNYVESGMVDWFNGSRFAKGPHAARIEPFNGYIAPPLDGVWMTAPYLHNGSVPTLEALLDSRRRPAFWERSFRHPRYDLQRLGWVYREKKAAGSTNTYNTTLPGYGNKGHPFGDRLTEAERRTLLEYLKTI
ncbi:MAG: c-type cytochrome [Bacteroidetes bacterium]|nr:c-type cytochrome [Bacteroidota bacterium]